MEDIEKRINYLYKKLFPNKHPFVNDLKKAEKINVMNNNEKFSKLLVRINKKENQIIIDKRIKIKEKEELDKEELKRILNLIDNEFNLEKIKKEIDKLLNKTIPSNILNCEILRETFNRGDKINIMIIGGGPMGLFLSLYLDRYYNKSFGLNAYPKVNIILADNRINKSGLREPFNRNRKFSFSTSFFSYILPKIYCDIENYRILDIYLLEYILFTKAYFSNINILFEDYDWEGYKCLVDEYNIDVVYDCTGGRLPTNIKLDEKDKKFRDNLVSKFNLEDYKINYNNNLVYIDNSNFIKNYYYGSIYVYKNKKIKDKIDFSINNIDDLNKISKAKNLKSEYYYDKDNIEKIIYSITDNLNRNYLYQMVKPYDCYFKVDLFYTYLRHQIKISQIMKTKDNKFLLIGAGDTIFHSHFYTGSGLNRTINFGVKTANMLINLKD